MSTSGMKDSRMEENQRRIIRGMVRPALWKWLWRTPRFDTFSKNVNQTWCLKATEFKFEGDDVGTLRQHVGFSESFYSVANNAGKVDRNYEFLGFK